MAEILANNKEYNGITASVQFVDGVGSTNDPHLIQWFELNGFTVNQEKKQPKPKKAGEGNDRINKG
jgi:hypothetical protein